MNKYILINEDFNIEKILESGQNYLYKKNENKYVFKKNKMEIESYTIEDKTFLNISEKVFKQNLYEFFDMNINYEKIRNEINEKFPELKKYTEFGKGIRFINQDFLECSTTFIISQNNNIPRILNSLKQLKEKYGENNEFPSLEKLKTLNKEDFSSIGVGFRDKYLVEFFKNINEEKIKELKTMNTKQAKEELMKYKGIGPKVSNCILLFCLEKRDVFPVDVHIKRIMEEIYFEKKETKEKIIEEFALQKFGKYSAYIQQYLFFYCIKNK